MTDKAIKTLFTVCSDIFNPATQDQLSCRFRHFPASTHLTEKKTSWSQCSLSNLMELEPMRKRTYKNISQICKVGPFRSRRKTH